MEIKGNYDYHAGFAVGLMYALAQNNGGKAVMGPITIPKDEIDFDPEQFKESFKWINEEAGVADYILREVDGWWHLWIATTENDEPLPEDWIEHL